MENSGRFGSVLARLRREQGFESPHAFYRSREGRRNLGLTFANYLNVERGKSLPRGSRLKGIIQALGLRTHSPQARELVRAYVAEVLGSDELLEGLGAGGAAGEGLEPRRLAEDAARQSLSQRTADFSLEQWRAVSRDPDCYACHTFLVNSPGWVNAEELAQLTGLAPAALKRALRALAAARVVELSGARARSPYALKHIKLPVPLSAASALSSAMYKHRQSWIEKGAKLSQMSWLTVRMPKAGLERYWHHVAEAVNLSAVYGDVERTEDSAIYLVEGRAYRVFP